MSDEPGDSPEAFLSARAAAKLLGVKTSTLYAYVSRGQIQSVAGQGRARRYRKADVLRLKARREGRDRGAEIGSALRWGEPVLDSSITEVRPDGPYYRGQSAVALARDPEVCFEQVAELLWTGSLPAERPEWPMPPYFEASRDAAASAGPDSPPLAWLAVLVPTLASRDAGRFERTPEAVLPRARSLIRALAELLGGGPGPESLAESFLWSATGRPRKHAPALDTLWTLWADHELNVSSFAARVAASANADLYSCVSAGLAALSGPRHGGACEQLHALLEEIKRPARVPQVVNERRRRGEAIPGFGHPLYPQGDPRALPMLELAEEVGPRTPWVALVRALVAELRERGQEPNVDCGTVSLAAALGVPADKVPGLIAIGRSAGWVAHILEQYEAGFLIRPRARFRPS